VHVLPPNPAHVAAVKSHKAWLNVRLIGLGLNFPFGRGAEEL